MNPEAILALISELYGQVGALTAERAKLHEALAERGEQLRQANQATASLAKRLEDLGAQNQPVSDPRSCGCGKPCGFDNNAKHPEFPSESDAWQSVPEHAGLCPTCADGTPTDEDTDTPYCYPCS